MARAIEVAFDEAQGDAFVGQCLGDLAGVAHLQVDADLRMAGVEAGDQVRQQVAAQGGAGAQAQLTVIEPGEAAQVRFGRLFEGEDALCITV